MPIDITTQADGREMPKSVTMLQQELPIICRLLVFKHTQSGQYLRQQWSGSEKSTFIKQLSFYFWLDSDLDVDALKEDKRRLFASCS